MRTTTLPAILRVGPNSQTYRPRLCRARYKPPAQPVVVDFLEKLKGAVDRRAIDDGRFGFHSFLDLVVRRMAIAVTHGLQHQFPLRCESESTFTDAVSVIECLMCHGGWVNTAGVRGQGDRV